MTPLRLVAALALALGLAGGAHAKVTESSQAFGAALYREKVTVLEQLILHSPSHWEELDVTVSTLMIKDHHRNLSLTLNIASCDPAQTLNSYDEVDSAQALTRLINTTVLELMRLCKLDVYQMGAERQRLLDAVDDTARAVAHMRQRAVTLVGFDKRCEHRPPPPKSRRGDPQPPLSDHQILYGLRTCGGHVRVHFD